MNYLLTIIFNKFFGYDVIEHNGEEGLFLPMKKNGIRIYKNLVFLRIRCVQKNVMHYADSHYCVIQWDKNKYKELKAQGLTPPIVGNLKPITPKFIFDKNKPLNENRQEVVKQMNEMLDDDF